MVKLRVTAAMRSLFPDCTEVQHSEEIEYKVLKHAAKAAKIPLSTAVKGSEFVFADCIQEKFATPEPAFIQEIREKRLIREYSQMTANLSNPGEKSGYSEGIQSAAFSATMISLLFLSFLVGYFGGLLIGLGDYTVSPM